MEIQSYGTQRLYLRPDQEEDEMPRSEAGETAQWLEARAALPEDLCSILSHLDETAHNCLYFSSSGYKALFWHLQAVYIHSV